MLRFIDLPVLVSSSRCLIPGDIKPKFRQVGIHTGNIEDVLRVHCLISGAGERNTCERCYLHLKYFKNQATFNEETGLHSNALIYVAPVDTIREQAVIFLDCRATRHFLAGLSPDTKYKNYGSGGGTSESNTIEIEL